MKIQNGCGAKTGHAGMTDSAPSARSVLVTLSGLVQGVGFRPFLHRIALQNGLDGWARNTSGGLEAFATGAPDAVEHFLQTIQRDTPPLSRVERMEVREIPADASGTGGFHILDSAYCAETTFAGADTAPCPDCEKELFTPGNRRFGYPFINCTNCGPRYTIIRALPYDRSRTVMDAFPMCPDCRTEYEDIRDRRYHAQPDCCPDCGPSVFLLDADQKLLARTRQTAPAEPESASDPFTLARRLLADGKILAIKGVGGIHLACNARDPEAVARLRQRKNRPYRPLALMARDLETVRNLCRVSDAEAQLLSSQERPVLLLSKREADSFPDISFSRRLGIMLPYSPTHLLLLPPQDTPEADVPASLCTAPPALDLLVMTSANKSGCPVLTDNEEALMELSGVADAFLLHDRPIENRCDDSVAICSNQRLSFFRRSRGYAPLPFSSARNVDGIISFGAEQTASFAVGRGHDIFVSPHIGDLKNLETLEHYREALALYRRLFLPEPSFLVCDLHPDYFSTQEARTMRSGAHTPAECKKVCAKAIPAPFAQQHASIPLLPVQHHWAHMVSCMEDNGLEQPVFGIIWDGTGLGTDGTIWGAEFLSGDAGSFSRKGSIRPIRLPGGDKAASQIWRTGLSLLQDSGISAVTALNDAPAGKPDTPPSSRTDALPSAWKEVPLSAVSSLLSSGVSCPEASSMGRLFDGIFSIVGDAAQVSFDGEAPQRLEALCPKEAPTDEELSCPSPYPLLFYEEDGLRRFDTWPLVRAVWNDRRCGIPASEISRRFHLTLCHLALSQCLTLNPDRLPVVLSGGVFLNVFLSEGIRRILTAAGFNVFCHHRVPAGDAGLSLGQLVIAAQQRENVNENHFERKDSSCALQSP